MTSDEYRTVHRILKENLGPESLAVVLGILNQHKPKRHHKVGFGNCATCDHERAADNDFHPPHDASPNCESGHRNHCSCDICF